MLGPACVWHCHGKSPDPSPAPQSLSQPHHTELSAPSAPGMPKDRKQQLGSELTAQGQLMMMQIRGANPKLNLVV